MVKVPSEALPVDELAGGERVTVPEAVGVIISVNPVMAFSVPPASIAMLGVRLLCCRGRCELGEAFQNVLIV